MHQKHLGKAVATGGASYRIKGLKPLPVFGPTPPEISQTKIKTDLTGYHILRLKCTKIDFFLGSAPDPAGGTYSAPLAPRWIKEDLLQREEREGKGLSPLEKKLSCRHWL